MSKEGIDCEQWQNVLVNYPKAEQVQEHNMAGVQGGLLFTKGCCWNSKVLPQGEPRFILKNIQFIHNATNF